MVLTGIFILPIELKGLDRNLESNISNTASILSYDSEIIEGLNKKHFSKNLIRRMVLYLNKVRKMLIIL